MDFGLLSLLGNLLGGAVNIGTNIDAHNKAQAERDRALGILKDLYGQWGDLSTPELKELAARLQGPTELGNIREDPRLREMQFQALNELSDIVGAGGAMTPEDYLAYNKARQNAASMDLALRGAAESQASQRGLGATGALVGDLLSNQAATNRMSNEGLQAASDARERYLKALDELGSQSSTVRGQEYGIAANAANAQDSINRFNESQKWMADTYGNQMKQQDFQNQMARLSGLGGAGSALANNYMTRGNNEQRWGAQLGGMLGAGLGELGDLGGAGAGLYGQYAAGDYGDLLSNLLSGTKKKSGSSGFDSGLF